MSKPDTAATLAEPLKPVPDLLPAVLFDEDVCGVLRISLTTLKRRRHAGAFPIPELPLLDKRHRYARADVEAFLAREIRPTFAQQRVLRRRV
jgi:hypothetical protein